MANSEKVVVITGASSGIGRATALEFARKGCAVVLGARRENALHALEQECRRLGGKAIAFPLDVTYEQDVRRMAERAIQEFGKIDIWINNAGVSGLGRFEDTPIEDIRRIIDINLFGYIHGAKAVIPHFKERKEGILINVSSIVGLTGQPYSAAYTISKFAIRGLSISLQQELSNEKNIHVCTVLPGTIDTPLFQHAANYMGKEIQAPGPAKEAEDVAKAIISLTQNPKREITIGRLSRVPAYLTRAFSPKLFDKQFRKLTYNSHFTKEPSLPTKGNLYDPMKEYASISGGWQHEEENKTGKTLAIAGAIVAGAAGATLLARQAVRKREQGKEYKKPEAYQKAYKAPESENVIKVQQ